MKSLQNWWKNVGKPVKPFHRSPINRGLGDFLQFSQHNSMSMTPLTCTVLVWSLWRGRRWRSWCRRGGGCPCECTRSRPGTSSTWTRRRTRPPAVGSATPRASCGRWIPINGNFWKTEKIIRTKIEAEAKYLIFENWEKCALLSFTMHCWVVKKLCVTKISLKKRSLKGAWGFFWWRWSIILDITSVSVSDSKT